MKLVHIAAACALAVLPASAPAQDYPSRAIRFVVPFTAGSATDALARILGQKLNAVFGWTVVVENIAGASGETAASNVARAAPDGYTVFVTSTTHAANANLFKKLSYDPIADFEPVTRLGNITLALAVHPSVPAATVAELIAYGKANPGKLSFGAGSTSARMASEMLKALGGFEMLHVPYRANPLAVADLLGGQISLVFADISTTLPQIRAGKVKGLGVHDRGGPARFRDDRLVRRIRSGEDPAARCRQAQRRFQDRDGGQVGRGGIAHRRDRAGNEHARGAEGLCRLGNQEVGRDREDRRHRGGVRLVG
jgi:tripartite-type tricarboxylate transporter receptor subunit TctC